MTLTIRYAARSDVGLLRPGNEDAAYAGPRLLAVADGMGGHAAGEVASSVAIESLTALDEVGKATGDPLQVLERALTRANDALRDMVAADQQLEGMGTTVTALLVDGRRLGLVHIGDSRAYLFAGGQLTQLTHDHTLVQRLVDEGRIAQDEAGQHPQRSLITRALDGRHEIEFDKSVRELRPGDRYLLCSDGLTAVVSDRTLQETLALPDPQEAVDRLVELALRGGGPDNVTCIVADVVEDPDRDGTAASAVPVLAGAAAGTERPRGATQRGAKGPNGGSTLRPAVARAEDDEDRSVTARARRIRRRRATLLALLVALLLGVGAVAGWRYVQSQYYVADHDGQVAIFRGVSGSVAGIELSRVHSEPGLPLAELPELEQAQVRDGIQAVSLADARAIIDDLRRTRDEAAPTSRTPAATTRPASATPS